MTAVLSPPEKESPQVTTEPSLFKAAKALSVEKIWETPEARLLATARLLLPVSWNDPHVPTEPSLFKAAKAPSVEKILETPAARLEATAG